MFYYNLFNRFSVYLCLKLTHKATRSNPNFGYNRVSLKTANAYGFFCNGICNLGVNAIYLTFKMLCNNDGMYIYQVYEIDLSKALIDLLEFPLLRGVAAVRGVWLFE